MNRLSFVLSSRGFINTLARSLQILERFGISAKRMHERLLRYVEVVNNFNCEPSLPITACVLARNPDVAKSLLEAGAELCVHGLFHNNISKLSEDEQREQIARAIEIFDQHGIAFEGFRSPYLKYNAATLRVIEDLGFQYDSNLAFFWDPLESLGNLSPTEVVGLRRGLDFYKPAHYPEERSLPRLIGNLIEIPVSLPDDEILLDRMGMRPQRISEVWLEMLHLALERNELLTIQLHPERLDILRKPLENLLEAAVSSGVWLAPLREISNWWRRRMSTEITLVEKDENTYVISLSGSKDVPIELFDSKTCKSIEIHPGRPFRAERRPIIGLEEANEYLIHYLRQIGYFFETKRVTSHYSAYIGSCFDPQAIEGSIEKAQGGLLRAGLWPRNYKAALAVTGDIDCLTLGDFVRRFWEA